MKTKRKALSWILSLALACSVFNIPLMGGSAAYAQDEGSTPTEITVQMENPQNEDKYLNTSSYSFNMSTEDMPEEGKAFNFRVLLDGNAYVSTSSSELEWSLADYSTNSPVNENIAKITDHEDGTATVTMKPVEGDPDIYVIATYTYADENGEEKN